VNERTRNRSRRQVPATPVTKLLRVHVRCREGMHLACPGTVGRRTRSDCLCDCHKGIVTTFKAAR
jgi:hypothetical protein